VETVNQILKILEGFSSITGSDLVLRIIFIVLGVIGGIYFTFMKRKARRDAADRQAQRDRDTNVRDNERDENQNSQDSGSVRDRLRGSDD